MTRSQILSSKEQWVPSAVPFFLFGFVYYLIVPAIVVEFLSSESDLLFSASTYLSEDYFDLVYFLDALIVFVAFLSGYFLARVGKENKVSVLDYGYFQTKLPLLLAIIFAVFIVLFCLIARASGIGFFTGYSTYNILVLGPFSTCAFMSVWFVNYFSNKQIRFLFLCLFIVCSALLLGWGSRMYFVLSSLALVLGAVSKNRKLLRSVWFQLAIGSIGVFMLVIGILRHGGGEFSSDALLEIFFAEPLFVSLTGSLYLGSVGSRPVYSVPYDLFAALINFIPSAIYPGKIDLMSQFTYNEYVYAPFGGRSLISNLYPNFGYFYPIYVGFIGFYFGFLYRRAKVSVFFRAIYFSALPILMFHFYREGLTTFVKLVFFNGLFLPLIIALFLTLAVRRKSVIQNDSLGFSQP